MKQKKFFNEYNFEENEDLNQIRLKGEREGKHNRENSKTEGNLINVKHATKSNR